MLLLEGSYGVRVLLTNSMLAGIRMVRGYRRMSRTVVEKIRLGSMDVLPHVFSARLRAVLVLVLKSCIFVPRLKLVVDRGN